MPEWEEVETALAEASERGDVNGYRHYFLTDMVNHVEAMLRRHPPPLDADAALFRWLDELESAAVVAGALADRRPR